MLWPECAGRLEISNQSLAFLGVLGGRGSLARRLGMRDLARGELLLLVINVVMIRKIEMLLSSSSPRVDQHLRPPATLWRMTNFAFTAPKLRQLDELECHDGLAVMGAPEYDARDVLDKYVSTLNKPSNRIVRDAAELSHPKDIIKFVLQHCIKTIDETDKQSS